jgi:hypothetical protein
MHTNTIILCLKIPEHRLSDLRRRMRAVQGFHLPFQCFEKGFGARSIPARTLTAHALANRRAATAQGFTNGVRALLNAPVRMEPQARLRLAVGNRPLQSRDGSVDGLPSGASGPATDLPVDHGQVHPGA